jgi:hypothetical protein
MEEGSNQPKKRKLVDAFGTSPHLFRLCAGAHHEILIAALMFFRVSNLIVQ